MGIENFEHAIPQEEPIDFVEGFEQSVEDARTEKIAKIEDEIEGLKADYAHLDQQENVYATAREEDGADPEKRKWYDNQLFPLHDKMGALDAKIESRKEKLAKILKKYNKTQD